MNMGEFRAQINDAWSLSKRLSLDGDRVWYPNYPVAPAATFKGLSYSDTWLTCRQNNYYDFSFRDGSLVQFICGSTHPLRVSYSYYECPYESLPYEEFVEYDLELDPRQVGDLYREEYEIYLTSQDVKETVTPLRYDFAPDDYIEGTHPASHIHFGHASSIRVGTDKILKPMSFLLFLIRQCYVPEWKALLKIKESDIWCRNVRDSLQPIESQYLKDLDAREMMLK